MDKLRVLLVGSGGREHALAWKIAQSPLLDTLYVAPGNGGTALLAANLPISDSDIEELLRFALSEAIDLTVVGPEAPLVSGIADRFREHGCPIVGPSAAAARLEGSKVFAKEFFRKYGIPTAAFRVYSDADSAEAALTAGDFTLPVVVKADGLAAGKGVIICRELPEARNAVSMIMRQKKFGTSGDRVVIEEFLEGEEVSFMVFSDGERVFPMVPSQDHKAVFDGDRGPNTGGMGAYSVDSLLAGELRDRILNEIIRPTVRGLAAEGTPFHGILYAGLMLTRTGPKVLEYNVRFGDPETQAVLARLDTDLLGILWALASGDLTGQEISWKPEAAVCVVVASAGYPGAYQKGFEISGISMAEEAPGTVVFQAGTVLKEGRTLTAGGRVLGVTSLAPSLEAAIIRAYEAVNKIHFEGMYYRRDIAAKGVIRSKTSY